jgi:PIN domain nuclease of toxin-antitoxin system
MGHRLSRWLADACAVIGLYRSTPNFPIPVRALLEDDPEQVAVAATPVWEIAIRTASGKLPNIRTGGHATLAGMLQAHGFDLLPLDAATAEQRSGSSR